MSSDEPSKVNWEYLPDEPKRFFALQDGFDRRDLKRAYNGYLRRFKPERFPDEFKLIRAAFEKLEARLRWHEENGGELEGFDPDDFDFGELLDEEEDIEGVADPLDGVELLRSQSLDQALAKLGAWENKSPENWCQLALLRDELESDPSLRFIETLIEGHIATEGAHPVSTLLYSACREELPPELAESLLERLYALCLNHGHVTGYRLEGYFYYTDQLWLDLAVALPFEEFSERLEAKRLSLGDLGHEGYLRLLIQLIPRVGLRADSAWVEEAMREVDESYHELSSNSQDEVAKFDWLDRYRSGRAEFLNGDPIRAQIDETLDQFGSGDIKVAAANVTALLASFREDPDALMKAFPPSDRTDHSHVLDPLWWFADENYEEIGLTYERPSQERIDFDVLRFAEQIEKRTDWSVLGVLWVGSTLSSFLCMLSLVIGMPILLLSNLLDGQPGFFILSMLAWVALITVGSFRGFLFKDALFLPSAQLGAFFSKRLYKKKWRRACYEFLRRTHLTLDHLRMGLEVIEEPGISNHQYLWEQVSNDTGMAFYALAVQFADERDLE